ncbi:plasmid pRiA4b ORF-3 family protein [Methylobacter sp. G7]|uniref:plasmid pRiA4b ORF-3 family protein n=1 Tax=Methylobacter sp. G7 TaxID=3230117 RepID=UPI003D801A2F
MANKLIYQFRVTLLEITPPIWRRIQVPADYSFWDLHVAIQDSMGWLDYHLHEFRVNKPRSRKVDVIGIPDTETDHSVIAGWEVPISEYFVTPGVAAAYDYDFGDGWCHEVLLEGILLKESSVKYPVCVTGERACPPEDCGGIPGYETLLNVLVKPRTEECKDMNAWLKGHAKSYFPYKPEHFDPCEVKFWNPKKRWQIAFGQHA